MTACVNGCIRRPKAEGEIPVPKEATHGLLCSSCYARLGDWLRDIPVDYALLPMQMSAGGAQVYDGTGRTKQPEAPAPLRLEIAALADGQRRPEPRVALPDAGNPAHHPRPAAGYSGIREPGDELWYELPDIAKALPVLHVWAEQLRCDLDPGRDFRELNDTDTVQHETGYLLKALQRLSEAEWVDECMGELKTVWQALTRAHGLVVGDKLGTCFDVECSGGIWRDRWTAFPTCRLCGRDYSDPKDALKLRLTEEQAARHVHTSATPEAS